MASKYVAVAGGTARCNLTRRSAHLPFGFEVPQPEPIIAFRLDGGQVPEAARAREAAVAFAA